MQMRPQGWFCLTAVVALGTGCVTTTTSDNDGRSVRLPTGVTLLDSDRDQCAGSVALEESVVSNAVRSDLVIEPGENVTFAVDADPEDDVEIEWTCVGTASTDRNAVVCPDDTDYVRITRGAGDDFVLECYGDRRSTTGSTQR
jgi:hypothetical protein